MSKRETYSDSFTGEADKGIRSILGYDTVDQPVVRIKRVLVKVINTELTQKQKEIVMLYYYKNIDTVQIAKRLGVTPQAVCAVLSRARLRIYRILKYYLI